MIIQCLNTSRLRGIYCILGTENGTLWIIWLRFLKLDKNMTVPLCFSLIKVGSLHSALFTVLSTPTQKTFPTSFLNTISCALGTGYNFMWYVLESGCSSISTFFVFYLTRVLPKRKLCVLNTFWSITLSSSYKGLFFDTTLHRSDFL